MMEVRVSVKRTLPVIVFMLCVPFVFAAQAVDIQQVQLAVQTAGGAVLSTFAATTSVPAVTLDGVEVERFIDEDEEDEAWLTYLRSDVASMCEQLENPSQGRSMSLFERVMLAASTRISPICKAAVSYLEALDLEEGDAVIDGVIVFTGDDLDTSSLSNLVGLYLMRDFSSIDFSIAVSIIVSGAAFSSPLAFEGRLSVCGSNEHGGIILTCESMTCNNQEITIAPMFFAAG